MPGASCGRKGEEQGYTAHTQGFGKALDPDSVRCGVKYGLKPLHSSVFWGDRMLTLDKAAGFFEEEGFKRSYQTIRGSHIYDSYNSPHTIAWRLHTLVWAARSAIVHEGMADRGHFILELPTGQGLVIKR